MSKICGPSQEKGISSCYHVRTAGMPKSAYLVLESCSLLDDILAMYLPGMVTRWRTMFEPKPAAVPVYIMLKPSHL